MPDVLLFVIILLTGAIILHAYNMGWQAGHDVHHDDSGHKPEDPEPPRSLWV